MLDDQYELSEGLYYLVFQNVLVRRIRLDTQNNKI